MHSNLSQIRTTGWLILILLLCQCTPAISPLPKESRVESPPLKKLKHPYVLPPGEYLVRAKNLQGPEKQQELVYAAGRLLSEGRWRQASAILAHTEDLTGALAAEKKILLAQIAMLRRQPAQALGTLNSINEAQSLSLYQRSKFYELLAQANEATEKMQAAILPRMQLQPLVQGTYKQQSNYRHLWLDLNALSSEEIEHLTKSVASSEFQGWLQLASFSRQHRQDFSALLHAVKQWQAEFPQHPAQALFRESLATANKTMTAQPKHVALLLPLSGPLQGPGTAVYEGFMDAYHAQSGKDLQVKTYDTALGDITAIYQKALLEGANYVIGPLVKSQVAVVAALTHPVPTLLLNDTKTESSENAYLFGLSPTHEALQVANKARHKGYQRALIISPASDWGQEISTVFSQQWKKRGGQITEVLSYQEGDDLNQRIKSFLHVSTSQQREKQIKQLLGEKIETLTNRRQDFDMIFLLAYPSKARQLMPLLRYYGVHKTPVFATSTVYAGHANAIKDKDLDGLIFCDIPWVFSHQSGMRQWPEQFNSYNRLFALGKESYALTTQLTQLILFPANQTEISDSALYLKGPQITRILEWGQFRQGLVHSLGERV